jgi:dolichol-phosphate mannosyltransferase
VPFYNEETNVSILAGEIIAAMETAPDVTFECVFVNDGSVDGTPAVMDQLAAADPRIRALHLPRNMGQSAAVVTGMRQARGRFIATLDGDLQNDPADLPKVYELLQSHDCVCGYRAQRNDSAIRKLSSRVANAVRQAVLADGIRDAGCGTKGFRRECVDHVVPFNGAHRFFAVMMRAAGFSIVELAVRHRPRQHGESKYGINNRLWRGIYDLIGVGWLRKRYLALPAPIEAGRTENDPS